MISKKTGKYTPLLGLSKGFDKYNFLGDVLKHLPLQPLNAQWPHSKDPETLTNRFLYTLYNNRGRFPANATNDLEYFFDVLQNLSEEVDVFDILSVVVKKMDIYGGYGHYFGTLVEFIVDFIDKVAFLVTNGINGHNLEPVGLAKLNE